MQVLNLDLIRNPYNWIIIMMMVMIAAFVWGLVDPLKTLQPQGDAP